MKYSTSMQHLAKNTLLVLFLSLISVYNSHAQVVSWAKSIGGLGSDNVKKIIVDPRGNIYMVGVYSLTVDFDPSDNTANLTSVKGSNDIFVSKYDANGNYLWAKSFGGSSQSGLGNGVAVDLLGNVYFTGSFQDTVDFDPGAGIANLVSTGGSTDIFVCKLTSEGNYVWAKQMNGFQQDNATSIAVDLNGNVYTTGAFRSTVDFDPGVNVANLISNSVSYDIFISKLDTDGKYLWAKNMGGAGTDIAYELTLDKLGNVYFTGSFQNAFDFDPGSGISNVSSSGGVDIFMSKFSSAGNHIWSKSFGGVGADVARSIALDTIGNVYITGSFQSNVDFDAGLNTQNLTSNNNTSDVFISKYDSAGTYIWAKRMGGSSDDQGLGVSVDAAGNVYTTGSFIGTVDFDPGAGTANLTCLGGNTFTDIFISKLNSSGNYVWASNHGDYFDDFGNTIVADALGNVYTAGTYQTNVKFGTGLNTISLSSNNNSVDVFISKHDKPLVTQVEDVDVMNSLSLYPNPISNKLYFSNEVTNVQIFTIDEKKVAITNADTENYIDLSFLENGIYLVKFEKNGKYLTEKITKQ